MNFPQSKSLNSYGSRIMSNVILPDELITEVISFLNVKSLMRFKCVCKSWKTLISDPTLIKLHLHRSAKNKHLALFPIHSSSFLLSPVSYLLENNTSITLSTDSCFQLKNNNGKLFVIGSCNGLLCLMHYIFTDDYGEIVFYLWNPATRTLSNKIEFPNYVIHPSHCVFLKRILFIACKFAFGYDILTDSYKIVAYRNKKLSVFTLGDNVWRNIQSFPELLPPFHLLNRLGINDSVHVSGTINWFAMVGQLLIISLDLSTETYRQLMIPRYSDNMPIVKPNLSVLMDSLCFSHDFNRTDFIIWQMKEFGVEESWIQFLKISYQSISIYNCVHSNLVQYSDSIVLSPLCLSENGDTLILTSRMYEQAILYNLRDKRVVKTRLTNRVRWSLSKEYVESLVSSG